LGWEASGSPNGDYGSGSRSLIERGTGLSAASLTRWTVVARRGGKTLRQHPRTTEGNITTSRAMTRSEGLHTDAVRDAGQSID